MQELPLEQIRAKALQLHDDGQTWHFHVMSPTCIFNGKSKYAFVLEYPEKNEAYVYYSDQAEKELGQELSPLLHGAKILNQDTTDTNYEPSAIMSKIIKCAKELNNQGI
jgi:hypothetical protein